MATTASSRTPAPVLIEGDDGTQSDSPAEHVIVGVDFGYTHTGKSSYIAVWPPDTHHDYYRSGDIFYKSDNQQAHQAILHSKMAWW
jgi:hypothetical protein